MCAPGFPPPPIAPMRYVPTNIANTNSAFPQLLVATENRAAVVFLGAFSVRDLLCGGI